MIVVARGYDDRDGICDGEDDDENDDKIMMLMGNDEVTKIYVCWL
jgi:hypothetical protein